MGANMKIELFRIAKVKNTPVTVNMRAGCS